jgi:hypothetical protein
MDAKGGEPALEDEPGGRGAPLERVKSGRLVQREWKVSTAAHRWG